ncbi:MAG: hypothetical protein HY703_14150 [Gemmatimonadetes bacterium]|nr:hypothetical protein [Gemmatimonadota bacterium]
MAGKRWERLAPLLLVLGATALLGGCLDEEIIYRDRPLFEDPPQGAAGFLGYSKQDSKLSVCGNCHVGQHGAWKQTAHATAWTSLQESGSAQEVCNACHTVSEKGNAASGAVGYVATKDARYQDVQCENCHGAGLAHVQNPDASQPLAAFAVDTAMTTGCGECHRDTHHPFVEEWSRSAHALPNDHAAPNAACASCHEGKTALRAFGETADYLEKQDGKLYGITCSVCHDPHGSPNPAQLRFAVNTPDPEQNLCIRCHHKRSEPDPSTPRGAHSPQGPMLLGEAGWRPSNFAFDTVKIVSTHGTTRNPKLCAGCHVNSFSVTDKATGKFVAQATGHLFQAIPCLDAEGKPTTGSCAVTQRTFRSCAASGCHGSEAAARSAVVTLESRMRSLTNELNRLVAKVPAAEFKSGDGRITVGEGAKFNASLLDEDGSRGVHNPFLLEALLNASIEAVKETYKVQ